MEFTKGPGNRNEAVARWVSAECLPVLVIVRLQGYGTCFHHPAVLPFNRLREITIEIGVMLQHQLKQVSQIRIRLRRVD